MNYSRKVSFRKMYFIELLVKYFKKDSIIKILDEHDKKTARDPLSQIPTDQIENSATCEHVFMPIDSTGQTLACSKCGLVVNKKDLRYKNFFRNKTFE